MAYRARKCSWTPAVTRLTVLAIVVTCGGSCSNKLVTQGRASSFLIIEQLMAASGANPATFTNVLQSDVITNVTRTVSGQQITIPTIFEDPGRVIARLGFKDPGTPSNPSSPTSANYITVTSYRVVFKRADGRNTPGVDVPYAFEGATTFSVLDIGSSTFTLVRGSAKLEPPLVGLRGLGGALMVSTIAEITFYGHDQTGATVQALGKILVDFADWGDPQ
ncbi:MAG: hypothetical protein HYX76_10350 [Acidobacteria bacterium]|nr:hypothetical protein [Acidobacteriota bacterium]